MLADIREQAGKDFPLRPKTFFVFGVINLVPKRGNRRHILLVDVHDIVDVPRLFAKPYLQPRPVGDGVPVLPLDGGQRGDAQIVHQLRHRVPAKVREKFHRRKLLYFHGFPPIIFILVTVRNLRFLAVTA